ncbi:MAG: protein CapI [Alphaproteobacteria bacterium]|nr:MAG: protein CapI [Alphaproteobacteria bacterium]
MINTPVLVTGAAGFIGFHTSLRLLKAGRKVVGLDNLNDYYDVNLKKSRLKVLEEFPSFQFVYADISDKDALENTWAEKGPFLEVVHLAAQAGVRYSMENPYSYIKSNCLGHLTVMEMCRYTKGFKHLVYASSSSVYGGNKELPYSVEARVDTPISLYAATKKSNELMSHSYSHLYNIPQTGLRFFTVYGPWGRPDMALFIFTKAICEKTKLPVFNNGDMKRDFTYIDDIVSGILGVLENPPVRDNDKAPYRVLNIGNSRTEYLMDYIHLIEEELGQKADIDFMPMQDGDIRETYADITATTELTGYKPKTTIKEGVPRFITWYKEYYNVGT